MDVQLLPADYPHVDAPHKNSMSSDDYAVQYWEVGELIEIDLPLFLLLLDFADPNGLVYPFVENFPHITITAVHSTATDS